MWLVMQRPGRRGIHRSAAAAPTDLQHGASQEAGARGGGLSSPLVFTPRSLAPAWAWRGAPG
jgi:hypothetical protein